MRMSRRMNDGHNKNGRFLIWISYGGLLSATVDIPSLTLKIAQTV